ncbi:MAG: alanine racemase [Propionibacteriaceae bacterium]|nr:alanine racemase [Propionibacteriaceae bacterium]
MLYATCARIDLEALAHNVAQTRRIIGPDRALLAAVKANAYGHGAVPISRFLEEQGLVDWLGVATVPEAMALRDAGVRLPILKLSPCFPEELDAAVAIDLALTVTDTITIEAAEAAAARAGVTVHVHLSIDTGMRRLGCEPEQAARLARSIAACHHLDHQGIFTHLPVSDTAEGDGFTRAQLARFAAAVAQVQDARSSLSLPPVPLVHASNSGAVLRHPLDGLTMVRPGSMLYGNPPDADTSVPVELAPVMSLVSEVVALRIVPAGQTVSYGRTWTAPADTWIATVPVGYADGFSRLNSNTGCMLVGGRRRPVAGRVCMDLTMLDLGPVTDADVPPARVGDEVVWLGAQGDARISAVELARVAQTIHYEVTSTINPRVQRIYLP